MPDQTKAPAEVTVTIDGRPVTAAAGELIIDAAERAGVFIPRFCYHPRMKPVGMCRMCLVEVSGPRGPSLQPACYVSVTDGQEVQTESPAARKAQEGVLEFLLVNHPLDCPVCDKGGECPLQDQAMSHGPGESRFLEEKRHWAKPIALGPLTLLDRERCIQCARCTRFAEEIAGEPLIDFFGRGDEIEVAVFPDRPFTSYFSGNTVQICPVGALTSVPYRFKSRPWDLEQVETTCTFCAVGCRTALQSSAGKLVRQLGIDSDPVNQSWLCDRGRYGYEAVSSADRLTEPLVRSDGELAASTWNEALRDVAAGIRQAMEAGGPANVGIIGGARLPNEDQYAWSKLARAVIGTDNIDAQLGDGLPAELVASLPAATIDQACDAKVVVLLAGDLRDELPVLYLRLRAAAAHGSLKIIDCSPVPSALSEVAAAVLPAKPGEPHRTAELLVADGPAKEQSGNGSASAAELAKARAALAGVAPAEVVVVLGRTSVAESAEGVAAAAAVFRRGWPGVRYLPVLRRANVRGAIDMGLAPGMLPGRVTLDAGRAWFERQWGSIPAEAGLDTYDMLAAAANGDLGALVLLGADPLVDFPDRDLATRALERVPFLVAIDTLPSSSAQLADVVLPAAGWAERAGTTTNLEGRVTRLAQKVVPPGVARADWVIAAEIAERLGFELGIDHLEGIWEEIEEVSPAHRGATVASVYGPSSHDGVLVPVAASPVGLGAGPGSRGGRALDPIATPGIESVNTQGAQMLAGATVLPGGQVRESIDIERSGLVPDNPELAGASVSAASAGGPARPSPLTFDASRWPVPDAPTADSYSLRLVTRRSLYDHGTLVQAASSLAGLAPSPELRMRPKEAEQLGVADGGAVRVRSAHGELVLPLVADVSVPAGVAVLGANLTPPDEPGATALIGAGEVATMVRVETVGS